MLVQSAPNSYVQTFNGVPHNFKTVPKLPSKSTVVSNNSLKGRQSVFKTLFEKFKSTKFGKKVVGWKNNLLEFLGLRKKDAKPVTNIPKTFEIGEKPMKKRLKQYMNGIKSNEYTRPEKIEDILIKSGAKDVTVERAIEFKPSERYPIGRKKGFEIDGKLYILETHNDPENAMNTITRLYVEGAQNKRSYMNKFGGFQTDKFKSGFHHINSGLGGFNWIKG